MRAGAWCQHIEPRRSEAKTCGHGERFIQLVSLEQAGVSAAVKFNVYLANHHISLIVLALQLADRHTEVTSLCRSVT